MYKKFTFVLILLLFTIGFIFSNTIEIKKGNLKIVLYKDTGTFTMYYLSDPLRNRYEPVLFDQELGKTTAFFLNVDGRIIKLQKNLGVKISITDILYGGQLIYTINNVATVTFNFELLPSGTYGDDTVRIDITIENLTNKRSEFSLKGIFDTFLGESMGIHFSTALRERISTETEMKDVRAEKWIQSAGRTASLRLLFSGQDISIPESISAVNRERLYNSEWVASISPGRNFNSTYSVNDSALGVFWPAKNLESYKKMTIRMYMAVSDGRGSSFNNKDSLPAIVNFIDNTNKNEPSQNSPVTKPLSNNTQAVEVLIKETSSENSLNNTNTSLPQLTIHDITDDMLDISYIQSILNQIDNLTLNPELANQTEIDRLNFELDLILKKLGSR